MASQVPTPLVSETGKATSLVTASALMLGTQDPINVHQINREIVLKVTDLISLKCTAKRTLPGSTSQSGPLWLWENHGAFVWAGLMGPVRTQLCNPAPQLPGGEDGRGSALLITAGALV